MSSSLKATDDSTVADSCHHRLYSSCAGRPVYKEHEGKPYCVLHYPGKEKSDDFQQAFQKKLDDKDFNFVGIWFPEGPSFSDFEFTEAVDFRSATFSAEINFQDTIFGGAADFRDVTFNASVRFDSTFKKDANFVHAVFSADADFHGSIFNGPVYFSNTAFNKGAYFGRASFNARADFSYAKFSSTAGFTYAAFKAKADFSYAELTAGADFNAAFNAEADFNYAVFTGEAYFRYAVFKAKINLRSTTFKYHVRFGGEESGEQSFRKDAWLDLQFARIDKPDNVSFHTLTLRPHWFVNVDARKFDFMNVEWDWKPLINEEIEALKSKGVSQPHRLLSIACRRLAVNAEDNHRYDEASKFRYWSMYARQLETWAGLAPWWKFRSWLSIRWSHISRLPILRFFNRNWLYWFYWAASGYGERVLRAFVVLIGVWLLFALLYTQVGFARWEPRLASESDLATARHDEAGIPQGLSRALTYSFGVMTFQKPEPRPATTAAQSLVMLETILGPLQAALLALAIRRKFMR
jgi:hypothetical protein